MLPKTIELIQDEFIKEIAGDKSEANGLDIQYLNYCLTAQAYQKTIRYKDILSCIIIPREICSLDNAEITADKLFDATTLMFINGFTTNGAGNIIQTEIERIEEQYKKELSGSIAIWGDNYLYNSLMFNYICSDIVVYNSDCKIYRLERIKPDDNKYKLIKSVDGYLKILDNVGFHKCSRLAIYGLEKYYNIKGMSESDTKSYLRQNISLYITPYMMEIIKEYNINPNISDDKIKEDYVNLIYDFVQFKQSGNA